jgi:hypothetical protein
VLDRLFGPLSVKPRVAVECDTVSSLITAIESGRGIALAIPAFKNVSGKRLLYRPLAGTTEVFFSRHRSREERRCYAGRRKVLRDAAKRCERDNRSGAIQRQRPIYRAKIVNAAGGEGRKWGRGKAIRRPTG